MAQASWSGKLQIDGGQSLVLSNQVPLGWSASLLLTVPAGTPEVPAGTDGKSPQVDEVVKAQTAKVLDGSVTAQMVAIKADAYPSAIIPGNLTLTLQGTTLANKADLKLTGDLLIANADLLTKICPDWDSITVTSSIPQVVNVQILVVWSL